MKTNICPLTTTITGNILKENIENTVIATLEI